MRTGVALCLLLAAPAPAVAQERTVQTLPDRPDTVKAVVSGRVDLDYVHRSREVTAWTRSESNPTGLGAPDAASENTFEGFAAVRLDVQVGQVSAVFEFGTKRIDGNLINRWPGDQSPDVVLRELAVLLPELFAPGVTVELGISRWSYDLRGRGHALVFAPRRSATITRNIDSLGPPASEEQADARLVEAGFPNELQPVGGLVIIRSGPWHIDVVLLPAVVEEGQASDDEALYAADAFFKLDEAGSRAGAIVAVSSFESNQPAAPGDDLDDNTSLITVGVGLDLRNFLMQGLEVYGEVYLQFGDAGETILAGQEEVLEAAGRAAQVGFEYTHVVGNPMPVWFGANLTYYSGDDDSLADGDDEVGRFASYEGVDELLILENMDYGFDIDSNYTVFKINAGARFTLARENDLRVDLLVGLARQSEESRFGAEGEDALGNEFDVRASWEVSKQVVFNMALGFLAGSDLLEESLRAIGSADPEDSAWLWFLGTDVTF